MGGQGGDDIMPDVSSYVADIGPKFSPDFYDSLSRVPVAVDVLRELARRKKAQEGERPVSLGALVRAGVLPSKPKSLARFARHGGPNCKHLRGLYRSKKQGTPPPSSQVEDPDMKNTIGDMNGYGAAFRQHLLDNEIIPHDLMLSHGGGSGPKNLREIKKALDVERPDVFSQLTEADFTDYAAQTINFDTDIMVKIMPKMCGTPDIHSQQNGLCSRLLPLTVPKQSKKPRPDIFDGALYQDLAQHVRDDVELMSLIVPSNHQTVPVAPNFFMECKGRRPPSFAESHTQLCYYGAYGARAMHALRNHGKSTPEYDNKAYAYTALYIREINTLKLFSHHVAAPATPGGPLRFYMCAMKVYSIELGFDDFCDAVNGLRNLRDWAKKQRDAVIEAANAYNVPEGTT